MFPTAGPVADPGDRPAAGAPARVARRPAARQARRGDEPARTPQDPRAAPQEKGGGGMQEEAERGGGEGVGGKGGDGRPLSACLDAEEKSRYVVLPS